MPFTFTAIEALKPTLKPYSKADGGGLVLQVQPSGAKWWRFRYRFNGKVKMISFGIYPNVCLADARGLRESAKRN